MKQEIKICLPFYKVAYSVLYLILLSLVRGISTVEAIGPAMMPYTAILAVVFCADTYQCERMARRWENVSLLPFRSRKRMVERRILIEYVYLWMISGLGYFCFLLFQRPIYSMDNSFLFLYTSYLFSMLVAIGFWGMFAMTVSNIMRNLWGGMGVSLILWLCLYSTTGERMFGRYNIMSYAFSNGSIQNDVSWLHGSMVALILIFLFIGLTPCILRKRG